MPSFSERYFTMKEEDDKAYVTSVLYYFDVNAKLVCKEIGEGRLCIPNDSKSFIFFIKT